MLWVFDFILSEAVIEGLFETDEFPEEAVVAGVSPVTMGFQEAVEHEFGFLVGPFNRRLEEPGLHQARAGHGDKAGGDALISFFKINEAFPNALFGG
jgi:hypothetical protein